jgi:hypothetical protein
MGDDGAEIRGVGVNGEKTAENGVRGLGRVFFCFCKSDVLVLLSGVEIDRLFRACVTDDKVGDGEGAGTEARDDDVTVDACV